MDGIRTVKTNGSTIHHYTLNGSQIVTETWTTKSSSGAETPNHFLVYLYDENGAPVGLQYRTQSMAVGEFQDYFFEKNLQGDIIAIYTENGTKIGSYTYDAWGNCTISTESGTTTIQKRIVRTLNPFRYRGYYYDTETGFYYVSSRYYDPKVGRWINADGFVSTGQDIIGYNMFAYCGNNPVNRKDPTGQFWITALIVATVAVACTIALSGCSAQPTSDVGAAKPYVDMPGSNDPTSPNCYAYAIGSPVNEQPGGASGRIPQKWNDVYDVGKSVEADLKAKGYTVREISGPNAKVHGNEFKIALRVGTKPYAYNRYTGELYYDYHFMRQTSTGQWAEKHGYGGASILWDAGMTPDTIPWTLGGVPYYDSAIIYYAVGN